MGGSPENTVLHPLHQVQFATHAKLKVDDYYHNGARRRLRLHEKGGKEHEMPVRRIKALQVSRRRVAPVLQPAHFPRKMPAHLGDVLIRKLARLIPQLTS